LIFAAGVNQIPLSKFYFAMKWAKRICHAINVGSLKLSSKVVVPPSVVRLLDEWICEARKTTRPMLFDETSKRPVLFVDATLKNYGAVLVLPSQRVLVSGGAFENADHNIAIREAQAALYGIQDFAQQIKRFQCLELRVDNTTVEASLRRGGARKDVLASVIGRVMQQSLQLKIALIVERVATNDNPADEPSRSAALDINKLRATLATRSMANTRLGAGRLCSSFPHS
jgi:hypothetical protein